ncbi:regulator of Vps4 activity in the MVB pathway-domain-containing protein [Naematelia encephala]|uniref:Regulator of Vps4 activity in the MVB pathway-domain-containing protein n=1 Tax=Naematelia encephala TaxID=71784 RepID=A0A1Y2BJU4_9TREE|nr:regulator of Vps4 activity in the MVB pathway-domain-containing protein [Naematelia encephala]
MVPWNPARVKVQIRLSIQRLRTLQEKKSALAKKSRREIADLLIKSRVETARLRVEGLIQDDIYVELLELLELYVETLQARFGLLDSTSGTEPEASIADAVCSIVYAAPRTELKELQVLREMLMHKYGRAFSLALQPSDPPPTSVPPRILSKLALFIPSKELVDAYMYEIAKGYNVDWAPEPSSTSGEPVDGDIPSIVGKGDDDEDEDDDDAGNGGGDGGTKEAVALEVPPGELGKRKDVAVEKPAPVPAPSEAKLKKDEEEDLARRFERLKNLR